MTPSLCSTREYRGGFGPAQPWRGVMNAHLSVRWNFKRHRRDAGSTSLPLSLGAVSPGTITGGSKSLRAGRVDKAQYRWVPAPKMLIPWVIRKHHLKPLITLSIPCSTVISAAGIWQECNWKVSWRRVEMFLCFVHCYIHTVWPIFYTY